MAKIIGNNVVNIDLMSPERRLSVPLPKSFIDRLEVLAKQEDRSTAKQAAYCLKQCIYRAIEEGKVPPFEEGEDQED
ncbi:hypothetical protein H6G00_05060 [Leptolyngbya sp. FACHB-541]|uniref:hypothetical protein n=1 Tax=Leptolyngbya sp. FACHB-541 TaxID=2692810 RepID=UPI00168391CB|nr:hypothetical protein [Leptolyngbya sp. FACHB-541]MBD1995985.1 hypothetical protein [Leptolyngbya sp. FACHB-541]